MSCLLDLTSESSQSRGLRPPLPIRVATVGVEMEFQRGEVELQLEGAYCWAISTYQSSNFMCFTGSLLTQIKAGRAQRIPGFLQVASD